MTNNTIEQQMIQSMHDSKLNQALINYAISLTNSLSDAEDLVQKAWENTRKARETTRRDHPQARLCTVIRNQFINQYRTNKKHQKIPVDTDYQRDKIYNASDYNTAESTMTVHNIQTEIEQLASRYKEVIKLYIAGEKYEDIAQELNLPLGTVKSRIHDAKIILQENLRQLGIVRHKRKGQTTTNSSPIQTHPQTQQTE